MTGGRLGGRANIGVGAHCGPNGCGLGDRENTYHDSGTSEGGLFQSEVPGPENPWPDRMQDRWQGLHSAVKREAKDLYRPGAGRQVQAFNDIQAARRGGLSEDYLNRFTPSPEVDPDGTRVIDPNRNAAGRPEYGQALRTLQDDFAPLREARANMNALRTQRAGMDPGARSSFRDEMQAGRQQLHEVAQPIRRAERRGMTSAEFAARPLRRGGGRRG